MLMHGCIVDKERDGKLRPLECPQQQKRAQCHAYVDDQLVFIMDLDVVDVAVGVLVVVKLFVQVDAAEGGRRDALDAHRREHLVAKQCAKWSSRVGHRAGGTTRAHHCTHAYTYALLRCDLVLILNSRCLNEAQHLTTVANTVRTHT